MEVNGKSHIVEKKPDREVNMTFWLFFSITICVFGNSFLYGYNIGVVNSPAKLIKVYYAKVYLARDGIETKHGIGENRTNNLYYVQLPSTTTLDPSLSTSPAAVVTTTAAVSVAGTNNSGPAYNGTNVDVKDANDTQKPKPRDPFLARTEKEVDDDNFIEIMWSLTVAIFVLFGMIGAFISGKIADHFGRKKGMIIITFLMFLAAVFGGIPKVASSPECLIISRAFVGLHCGINVSLASLYLAEISPRKIRGAVGTCHQLFITIGILWSMIMGLPQITGIVYGYIVPVF